MIIGDDIKSFWQRFQSGFDVTVVHRGHEPEKSLGIRDGFLRYLHEVVDQNPPLAIRTAQIPGKSELSMSDSETLATARTLVAQARVTDPESLFVVACEEGLSVASAGDGEVRHLVKSWVVVDMVPSTLGAASQTSHQAWGTSGGLEIPSHLLQGSTDSGSPMVFPSTRRGGGMVQSITRGFESRRSAAALGAFLALSSLLYGRVQG